MFIGFTYYFCRALWHVKAVVLVLFALMVAGAGAVTHVEKIPFGDALYFSLVTGLTIGYGDIAPGTPTGRIISILLGVNGILFPGLVVAAAVHALERAVKDVYGHNR